MSARRRSLVGSFVATTAALGLAAAALVAASTTTIVPRGAPALRLVGAAFAAAILAGAAVGWVWARSLAGLRSTPGAAHALAARLPAALRRVVALVGGALVLLAAVEVVRGAAGAPAQARAMAAATILVTGGAALAALAVAAPLLAALTLRRAGDAALARTTAAAARAGLRSDATLIALGAIGPAAVLALGAGAAPAAVAFVVVLLVAAQALSARALDRATATAYEAAAARLSRLDDTGVVLPAPASSTTGPLSLAAVAATATAPAPAAPAAPAMPRAGRRSPPRPTDHWLPVFTAAAPVEEARALRQTATQLADRVTQLRLTRALAVERASESARLRTQFLANTSHELRTPLHAILGFSDLLLRGVDGPLGDEQRAQLEQIREGGGHLLRIVQEVLDLARLDAGRFDLVRMPAIAAELVEQAVEELKTRFPGLGFEVTTRMGRGLPTLSLDAYRVVQALTYLLTYATEAIAAGSARRLVRLHIAARRVERAGRGALELTLSAPDAVVEADEPTRVFDGFRLLTGRSGLGLGPHLARRFLELHGGGVHLVLDPGVRFEVTLPEAPGTGSPSSPSVPPPPAAPAAPGSSAPPASSGPPTR